MQTRQRTLARTITIASGLVCSTIFADTATAGCFSHTFEACQKQPSASYTVEVDAKTGATWLNKSDRPDKNLARIAERAADNFSRGGPRRGKQSHIRARSIELAGADYPRCETGER